MIAGNGKAKETVIEVRDVKVGFGDRLVLNGVDLDVYRGEVLGFVGGSGAGKSVLMRTIIGLLPKRGGTISVFGQDMDAASDEQRQAVERRWGVLFQQGALFSSLTVKENLQFPLREYLNLSQRLMDELALAKLEMVGLDASVLDKIPSELSGGMTKRVALARARPGHRLPRRADLRPRSDRRRRLRHFDRHAAADARADGVHGHPRPRQPAYGLRPHRGAGGGQDHRRRQHGRDARLRASLAEGLFSRQAFARGAPRGGTRRGGAVIRKV